MLLMSSCSLAEHVKSTRYSFPSSWQGYYEKISGGVPYQNELQDSFKITEDYMTYKNKVHVESDGIFISYQIDGIIENRGAKFRFEIEGSFDDQYNPKGDYTFQTRVGSTDEIKVTYSTWDWSAIVIPIPITRTAIYKKTAL